MKHLLLDANNVILYISDTIGYQENGNVLVDNDSMAFAANLVDRVAEVPEVPEGVVPQKFCYNGTFIENPNYVAPPLMPEERIAILEAKNSELQNAVDTLILSALEG